MMGSRILTTAPPNNGMHPTADTLPVIFGNGLGRRVMPGVRFLPLEQQEMIEIRYTSPSELDIAGQPAELEAIRRRILDLVEAHNNEIVIEADATIDPTPYEYALAKLTIAEGSGPVKVTVCDDMELRVDGSREALDAFASFFYFEPDAKEGSHAHYEYYIGNDLIDPESVPLVISVK